MSGSVEVVDQTHSDRTCVLTFQCPDRLGILARVTDALFKANIAVSESVHYGDPETGTFFARFGLDLATSFIDSDGVDALMTQLAPALDLSFTVQPASYRPRMILAVSKFDHCLSSLLYKWKAGILAIDICGVISNHETCRDLVEWYGIPYHYMPITKETKPDQEQAILDLIDRERAEFLILARYMQVLSDDLCRKLEGRAVNIHHSFLPSFKGARPYHQAYSRGVKVIGATAHYVTADLDEGPIIVQEVRPVDHTYSAERMVLAGQDIEAVALADAVGLISEGRVFLNGHRTVVLR
jgi:formyltetrahydrofolate deformylase